MPVGCSERSLDRVFGILAFNLKGAYCLANLPCRCFYFIAARPSRDASPQRNSNRPLAYVGPRTCLSDLAVNDSGGSASCSGRSRIVTGQAKTRTGEGKGEKLGFDGRDARTLALLDEDDLLGGLPYPK